MDDSKRLPWCAAVVEVLWCMLPRNGHSFRYKTESVIVLGEEFLSDENAKKSEEVQSERMTSTPLVNGPGLDTLD
jgi:hypothetical protein